MANVKEEQVEVAEEGEPIPAIPPTYGFPPIPALPPNAAIPPGYENRLRRSWPWPPLSRPRRSPRGHPPPRPYIRRPRRRVIKEEPASE